MKEAKGEKVKGSDLHVKIDALVQLGGIMLGLGAKADWPGHSCGLTAEEYSALNSAIVRAKSFNGWYTEENVRHAFGAWGLALQREGVDQWLAAYPELADQRGSMTVGLILAGNVPLVGLHDVICVWLTDHLAQVKTSSQEPELIPMLLRVLENFLPGTIDRIVIAKEKLGPVDAVIATGSNNTARYFEHYFGHLPRIIRKNRVSVAVLDGSETEEEFTALGEDVFRYFGLGCRNVSKLFLPHEMDLDRIFKGFFLYGSIVQHNKYGNNYDYTRALWLLDRIDFLENGFVLLKEDQSLVSPVATVFYERYGTIDEVEQRLRDEEFSIQCVVGHDRIPFGKAQQPQLWEYADGVDTLGFLTSLGKNN